MRYRRTGLVIAAAVLVTALPEDVRAHAPSMPLGVPDDLALVTATAPPIASGLLLLAGAALAMARASRRRRRWLPLALTLLVVFAGFEGALHAVHHLGDPSGAERCLVAASAEHVTGTGDGGASFAIAIVLAGDDLRVPSLAVVPATAPLRLTGRAPPA